MQRQQMAIRTRAIAAGEKEHYAQVYSARYPERPMTDALVLRLVPEATGHEAEVLARAATSDESDEELVRIVEARKKLMRDAVDVGRELCNQARMAAKAERNMEKWIKFKACKGMDGTV